MKNLTRFIYLFILIAMACSCGSKPSAVSQLSDAEMALEIGRINTAQQIADSLILGPDFAALDAEELCRLSLLYVRLSDENFPETNTYMAARALEAAFRRDSTATSNFIYTQLPPEQRPALALVGAIVEARNNPACVDDSLFIPADSIE